MPYLIRPLEADDEPLLWEMLYLALYAPPGAPPFPRGIVHEPDLARYVQGWGQVHDMGLAAVLEDTREPVGAAWLRLLQRDNAGYGYVDDDTPELSIAVRPGHRNQGLGTRLLAQVLDLARGRYPALSLSVVAESPAVRLYRRFGFEMAGQRGGSWVMKRELPAPAPNGSASSGWAGSARCW